MKLSHLSGLFACAVILAPLGAQAAMNEATRAEFTQQCIKEAKNQGVDDKTAKAHCECGARQIDKNFTDAEIKALNGKNPQPPQELVGKLRDVVAQQCAQAKN
ncbi:hypothetical protein BZK31_10730 [Pseudomonas floridensis]|uniref:Secreted protein n=1 Tax=Pseudomonas floridensis TaxID=1958950 RepID=A0A1X0N7Q2_9PSED|nr:hypothetical protein [Pseudomonas floridensis]ORC59426.1 hypothetical protein BZK31_10730 [Pseudomonas floridensis]